MALIDRVHDVGRVISVMDNKMVSLRVEIRELKESTRLEMMVAAEKRAADLQAEVHHLRIEVNDTKRRYKALQKELDDTNLHLGDAHRQLKVLSSDPVHGG
ncbi:hypothetical protein BHE74_00039918 [Ensete ventricosum]|nr:hypothetical protein BHE74_00039918 [Ensete ventricosum]